MNITLPTNATDLITLKWASENTAGLFPVFLLVSIFIIVLSTSRAYGIDRSIPAALFFTSIVASLMGLFGIVSVNVVFVNIMLLMVSLVPSIKSKI